MYIAVPVYIHPEGMTFLEESSVLVHFTGLDPTFPELSSLLLEGCLNANDSR